MANLLRHAQAIPSKGSSPRAAAAGLAKSRQILDAALSRLPADNSLPAAVEAELLHAIDDELALYELRSGRHKLIQDQLNQLGVQYDSEDQKETEVARIASDSMNKDITAEQLTAWTQMAKALINQRQDLFKNGAVDARRALYVADTLLGLGIASSIVPFQFEQNDFNHLTDDMFGWIFDDERPNSPYGITPRDLFTDKKVVYDQHTLETDLDETLNRDDSFPAVFNQNVANRMMRLSRSEGGLRPIDVYLLMQRVHKRQQQIVDSGKAYKKEPAFSTWPQAPGNLSPIDNLLHADHSQLPMVQ